MTVLPTGNASAEAQVAAMSLRVDVATAEVISAFDTAGIPTVLLKGPATAEWLYGPREPREYDDIDILVAPDRFDFALGVLASLDFSDVMPGASELERPPHAQTWCRDSDGSTVDLHRTVLGAGASHRDVWEVFHGEAVRIEVGGRDVCVPSIRCRMVLVVLHAIQHGPDNQRCIRDLRRAIAVSQPALLKEALLIARLLDAVPGLASGLRLVPEGKALVEDLGLEAATSAQHEINAAVMAPEVRATAIGFERLSTASWPERVRLLLRQLVPTPGYLRYREALANRGRLALVATYVARPIRLMRAAPQAFREWTRARRQIEGGLGTLGRAEVAAWSVSARLLVALVGFRRTVALLDAAPTIARSATRPIEIPGVRRLLGTCLHRSIARSQYLRVRGHAHDLVLGVRSGGGAFDAHAWLEPCDTPPEGFVVVQRVQR